MARPARPPRRHLSESRDFRLTLLSRQLQRRSLLLPDGETNPLKNASLSGISPSELLAASSVSSYDREEQQSERLAIYERAVRKILQRSVREPRAVTARELKTRKLRQLEEMEDAVRAKEAEAELAGYGEFSWARECLASPPPPKSPAASTDWSELLSCSRRSRPPLT